MTQGWTKAAAAAAIAASVAITTAAAPDSGVAFIGIGFIDGRALDKSGSSGAEICKRDVAPAECIDQATFGGFGSGLASTGRDDVFVAVPDRGPFDGRTDVPYRDRVHFVHMALEQRPFTDLTPNITLTLLDTRFLKDESARSLVGSAYAFDTAVPAHTLRFDPEAIAVSSDGHFFVSDEYGPSLFKFDRQGHLVSRLAVPEKFLLKAPPAGHPSGDVDQHGNSLELYPVNNTFGRQANRGMEGLTITPDGKTLVGLMQNALLQDNALNPASATPSRVGRTTRILAIDTVSGATREYVYVLDNINQGRGVNEILAINDHEFLVLERDNRSLRPTPPAAPTAPGLKRIYKIDLAKPGLTDVSNVASLPALGTQLGDIVPVDKTLVIDLLNPAYKVNATEAIRDIIAEKMEGLAWGPALPDGRQVLYVISDNDLYPGRPTQLFAFAVGVAAGIDYEAQQVPGPLFPPGQVKKLLQQAQ